MCLSRRLVVANLMLCLFLTTTAELDMHGLLQDLQQEQRYETLLLIYGASEHCPIDLHLSPMHVPRLLLGPEAHFYLKRQMSSQLLALVCLGEELLLDESLLQTLYANLQHMRQTPTLLLLPSATPERLGSIFLDCLQHKMINVLALSIDDLKLHSYRAYPHFQLRQRPLTRAMSGRYFEERPLSNLGGHAIRTMPDHSMPRSVVHQDVTSGERQLVGYVAKLVETFASSHNATLEVHWNDQWLYIRDIANLTFTDKLDLPMSISGITYHSNPQEYSYFVELVKWQSMLPVEAERPRSQLYFWVFKWQTTWLICGAMLLTAALTAIEQLVRMGVAQPLDCLDQMLRGFVAQSFPMPNRMTPTHALLCCLVSLYGLLLSNIYLGYLQMLFAHPPTEPEVRTYEDLRRSRRKILLLRDELPFVKDTDYYKAYSDLFRLANSTEQFRELRTGLDTSYVYSVTSTLWPLLVERQSMLKKPLFRLSDELLWSPYIPYGLPLEQNSIYKQPLDAFVDQVQATGLLQHWIKSAYFEMVRLRVVPFYQAELPHLYQDIVWQDFQSIWVGFALCSMLNCLAFIAELLFSRFSMTMWRRQCWLD